MGIAMLTAARLVQGVPQWIEGWGPRQLAARLLRSRAHRRAGKRVAGVATRPAPPLRVVRVLEPQQARTEAGRMVISGRMADVCAELDRLAAAEARGGQR